MVPGEKIMMITRRVLRLMGVVLIGSCVAGASAQVVTGTLGSPSATTTVEGKQLPAPPPKFGGVIKESRQGLRHPGGRRASCRPRARPTCC